MLPGVWPAPLPPRGILLLPIRVAPPPVLNTVKTKGRVVSVPPRTNGKSTAIASVWLPFGPPSTVPRMWLSPPSKHGMPSREEILGQIYRTTLERLVVVIQVDHFAPVMEQLAVAGTVRCRISAVQLPRCSSAEGFQPATSQ